MSRVKNTFLNFISKSANTLLFNILKFVSRTVFIKILGSSYLGINGLLTNVLSMLSLAELGIGTAITFSLYKPIAEKNERKIAALMNLYKKIYRVIGIVIFIIGLILMQFLDVLVPNKGDVQNLELIFILYVLDSSLTYFLSYKTTLLIADQKEYMLFKSNIFFSIINITIQLIVLIIAKNYIAYLVSGIIITFIQRIYVNYFVTKKYSLLNKYKEEVLQDEDKYTIKKNVKAMLYHKFGDYCINGTDSIIISMFDSIISVGKYSNYFLLFDTVNTVINMLFNSMTSSFGNVIASEDEKTRFSIFKKINFIGFWLYGFSAICFYNLINPFITLWAGEGYLLDMPIVIVLVINNYMLGMRIPLFTVKSAAGLYDEDKFVPIIQSIINLSVSIILISKLGLIGVFIGTFVSGMVPSLYRPFLVYKYVFKESYISYYIDYVSNIILLIFACIITNFVSDLFITQITIYTFILKMTLCIIIPNIIFMIRFRNTEEFKYILNIIKRIKFTKQAIN